MKENPLTQRDQIGYIFCVLVLIWNVSIFSQAVSNESKDPKEKQKTQSDRELIETGKLESVRKKRILD